MAAGQDPIRLAKDRELELIGLLQIPFQAAGAAEDPRRRRPPRLPAASRVAIRVPGMSPSWRVVMKTVSSKGFGEPQT